MQQVTNLVLIHYESLELVLNSLANLEAQNAAILDRLGGEVPKQTKTIKWWTSEELAVALKRKPFTVREWCRQGRIPAKKDKRSRLWRIGNKEAQRLIAGGKPKPVES